MAQYTISTEVLVSVECDPSDLERITGNIKEHYEAAPEIPGVCIVDYYGETNTTPVTEA